MRTVYPESKASQLELALDYKQPALIRQFAEEAIKSYLTKESQICTFDGLVDEVSFIHQLKPRIQIILNGEINIWQGGYETNIKRKRIVYKGEVIEL